MALDRIRQQSECAKKSKREKTEKALNRKRQVSKCEKKS